MIFSSLQEVIESGRKYSVIYADPPWPYRVWSNKASRTADAHYPTMSLADIKALPVADIAEKDVVLFMWVTGPNLPAGIETLSAWGFEYKTVGFTWGKKYRNGRPYMGLGYWTRANAELCLLGTHGKIKRADKGVSQLILSVPGRHSEKPFEVRDSIKKLMGPKHGYIELFARTTSEGWDSMGNQIEEGLI
jgi:N6-adenosine-specific RNA methylase IME4